MGLDLRVCVCFFGGFDTRIGCSCPRKFQDVGGMWTHNDTTPWFHDGRDGEEKTPAENMIAV